MMVYGCKSSWWEAASWCSARRVRVKSVREGLEDSLMRRIQLIESYAKVCL